MNYKPFRNEETRSSVLAGVRSGTEAAWGRFFDLYAGYVYSLGRCGGLGPEDAEDLVQTVFAGLAAPGGMDGYDRRKGAFRPWLRQRAGWRIADALRHRARSPTVGEDCEAVDVDSLPGSVSAADDESWIEAAREEALRRLREKASPEHFAIFQASVMEEIPAEEVMAVYRVSRANLYQIRKRMKAAFAACLKTALEEMDAPRPPGSGAQ